MNISTFNETNLDDFNNGTTVESTGKDTFNVISPELFLLLYKVLYSGVIPVTICIGLIGNSLTFVVFYRINHWTTSAINLFCLTLADTCALSSNAFFVVIINLRTHVPSIGQIVYAFLAPQFVAMIFYMFGRIATVLPVLISFERLVAITFPLHAKRVLTRRVTISLIVSCALFVIIWFIPKGFSLETYYVYDNVTNSYKYLIRETTFGADESFWNPYRNTEIVLFRIIPVFSTGIFSVIMLVSLFKSIRKRKNMMSTSNMTEYKMKSTEESREIRVTRTIVTVTCIYTLCSLPRAINRLLTIADPNSELYAFSNNAYRLFSIVTFELDNINSSVNFIIYIATSHIYRAEYKKIFKCFQQKDKQTSRNQPHASVETFTPLPL